MDREDQEDLREIVRHGHANRIKRSLRFSDLQRRNEENMATQIGPIVEFRQDHWKGGTGDFRRRHYSKDEQSKKKSPCSGFPT